MPEHNRTRAAFTLIELLLVLAIVGIIVAVTIPSFVRSIRGNRLRTAARTIVMAGRYARSMAVLRQRDMLVVLDLDKSVLTVRALAQGETAASGSVDPATPPAEDDGGPAAVDRTEEVKASGSFSATRSRDTIVRSFDRVQIKSVDVGAGNFRYTSGQCAVVFRTNGTCTPYEILVEDEKGDSIRIIVDALASTETEAG